MATPPARKGPARGGIPDGVLVGGIAFLLAVAVTGWLATGIAGLAEHGRWPDISFARTALALRRLASAPSDIEGAWSRPSPVEGLPGPTAFWLTATVLVVIMIALGLLATTMWARLRRPPVRKPAPEQAPGPPPVRDAEDRRTGERPGPATASAANPAQRAPAVPAGPPPPRGPGFPPAEPHTAVEAASAGTPPTGPAPGPVNGTLPAAASYPARPHPLSEQALLPRARHIRPEIPVIGRSLHDALAYGVRLGQDRDDGTELYGGLDQTFCVFGPPRSGRTTHVVHTAVADAPGPAIVTCDGPDTLDTTVAARSRTGPVLVFDPLQITDAAQRLRWSPVEGCEDPTTAGARARALLEPVRPLARTLLTDHHTQQAALTLLRCWLHAAALDRRPFRQVHRWANNAQSSRDPVKILRTSKDAAADWAGSLESTLSGHQRQLDAARGLTARALDSLSQLHILNSCTPSSSDRFRVESFLRERGTLYVVGEGIEDPRTHPGAMPLLTALVENVVEHGRRMAATSSSGRLDPPLLAALDDVATVAPVPCLPELMSVGGRVGIPAIAVLRSEEQARHRWGDRGATTIQQSANVRITMDAPGTAKIQLNDQSPVTSNLP